ncbi:MAG TPA: hypothetical protein VGL21_06810 [Jatrophihabitantaceae bacterium]|jgi:hypothetical protein
MAVSDDDGTAERLAQVRADRRHVRRLRVAQRRDATHEREAHERAEVEANRRVDESTTPLLPSGDTRELLAVEQDALALERASLADADAGIEMDM